MNTTDVQGQRLSQEAAPSAVAGPWRPRSRSQRRNQLSAASAVCGRVTDVSAEHGSRDAVAGDAVAGDGDAIAAAGSVRARQRMRVRIFMAFSLVSPR